jgi:hypothetical protein
VEAHTMLAKWLRIKDPDASQKVISRWLINLILGKDHTHYAKKNYNGWDRIAAPKMNKLEGNRLSLLNINY